MFINAGSCHIPTFITIGALGRILGEKWRALTDDDKAPYVKKAEADKERYEKEKLAYQQTKA